MINKKKEKSENFMEMAIALAKEAFSQEEVPVGAVVVDSSGKVISTAKNEVEKIFSQTGHAEALAVKKASLKLKNWRLNGCSIYVSLEPCLSCFGLISLSRISNLIYASKSPIFGFTNFQSDFKVYSKNLKISSGLKELESTAILKKFFEKARKS